MLGFSGFRASGLTFIAILAIALQSACSLKTPQAKSPPPADANKDKSTFVEIVGGVQKSRRFQCAWAPISETGYLSEWFLTHAAISTDHCNIEWRVEENYLLGKKVDPSLDPRDWKTIITIPIGSHYKRVKDKDAKGRETKDFVEKTTEDHWSRLPFMKLNLSGIQIHDWSYDLFGGLGRFGGVQVLAVEDEEISEYKGKKYWAFTLAVSSPFFGSELQARIRFNFLEFAPKPDFKVTPYAEENSRHLNVLHVLGKKFESETQALYNAHWDLSGGDRSIELCTYGVPAKYKKMMTDVVEDWNGTFAKIGQGRPFWLNHERKLAYPLDLRCPTMIWVQDKRITKNSPLGIGLINADVTNGQALWGGIVIYGGAFERYAKAFSPSDFAAAQTDQNPMPLNFAIETPFDKAAGPKYYASDEMMAAARSPEREQQLFDAIVRHDAGSKDLGGLNGFDLFDGMAARIRSLGSEEERKEGIAQAADMLRVPKEKMQEFERGFSDFAQTGNVRERQLKYIALRDKKSVDQVVAEMRHSITKSRNQLEDNHLSGGKRIVEKFLQNRPLSQIMMGNLGPSAPSTDSEKRIAADFAQMNPAQRAKYGLQQMQADGRKLMNSRIWDLDRTFAEVAPGWHSVPSATLASRTFSDRLMSMLKKTFSHEFGHFIGLGHNFKENILPRRGTLPAKYVQEAEENVRKYRSALTTVMGYDDPSVEVSITYEDIKPGPHDRLALEYVYNRKYPTWNGGDENPDPDFKMVDLPKDGKIPATDPFKDNYKTVYFPQCNDWHATLSLDPYCMRHDSGYNAATLVDNYFSYLEKNWIANANNIGETSDIPEWALYRWMWRKSFGTFAKVRHFYDYMVMKYRNELMEIQTRADGLMSFYKTCSGGEQNPIVVDVLRRANPELTELCKVNGDAIVRMRRFLEEPGSDFTEFDHTSSFIVSSVTGGDVDLNYSRFTGTWERLGMLPVKYAALLTMTSTVPYLYAFPGWVVPLYQYDNPGKDYKNLYSTFYPEPYTEAISATVRKNLKFKNNGDSSNTMGRSVLALGWMLDNQYFSNEAHRGVPTDYLENIRRQNSMKGGYVAVVLKAVKRKGETAESDRAVRFDASLYDFAAREFIPLGTAYVLEDAKIIFATPDEKAFIYPLTDLEFYSNEGAFAYAIRVTFTEDDKSSLWTRSSKVELREKYTTAVRSCLIGTEKGGVKNGLQDYFSASNTYNPATDTGFRGFLVQTDIAESQARFKKFKESIKEEFDRYRKAKVYADANNVPGEKTCQNALGGIGLVVTSSIAIQGWWMPEIIDYIVK